MAKRDNGAGHIYQRPSGSWGGRIYIGVKADGRPKYVYFSGNTQGEVKKKIREYNKKFSIDISKISVKEYFIDWLKTFKYGTVKDSSYDALERTILLHIVPHLGMIQLQQLTASDIQIFLRKMKDSEGYAYSTIKKSYDCLNSVFKHALINGDIEKNPMLLVKMPNKNLFETKTATIFSEKECALITEEVRRTYSTGAPVYIYGYAYILMLHTGIRMGEAIGLKKSDWNREDNTLHIQRNLQSVVKRDEDGNSITGKKLIYNTTKTYSGDRIIPLNKSAVEALENLCNAHPLTEAIICSAQGEVVPPERLERTFYRVLNNIGLKKTGVHTLRHTFASILFSKNVDVKTVSHLLGHASIQITLNTYIHLMDHMPRDAVSLMDSIA